MGKPQVILVKTIATGFGLGFSPIIPGTIGSLLGIPTLFIRLPTSTWIIISICLFLVGVVVATRAEGLFKEKDSRKIVIDEIVGCIIFLSLVPHIKWCIIIGFILYRFLDIIKPFPACISQSLPGGWGIMMDDLIAGVYAGGIINIINIVVLAI